MEVDGGGDIIIIFRFRTIARKLCPLDLTQIMYQSQLAALSPHGTRSGPVTVPVSEHHTSL